MSIEEALRRECEHQIRLRHPDWDEHQVAAKLEQWIEQIMTTDMKLVERAMPREKYIECVLEGCGRRFRSLTPHLFSHHGMDEKFYRELVGLPDEVPLTCRELSRKRSMTARAINERRKATSNT